MKAIPVNNNGDDEVNFNVEVARERLESLMGGSIPPNQHHHHHVASSSSSSSTDSSSSDPRPPPLSLQSVLRNSPSSSTITPPPFFYSARAQESRRTEIELLRSLSDSDQSLSDVWSHWFAERGPGPAHELLQAEELSNQGETEQAERVLRRLIQRNSIYWAEPINRLATLLYRQGRLEESRACCEIVLAVKPWHFGALSGIVLVCAGMKDYVNARIWADRRLPPMGEGDDDLESNERRTDWVNRAVECATLTLTNPDAFVTGISEDDEEDEEGNNKDEVKQVLDGICRDEGMADNSWQ